MEEEIKFLGKRKIVQKGRSVSITLPSEAVEMLNLRDEVAFFRKGNKIYLTNPEPLDKLLIGAEKAGVFSSPLSVEKMEELLKALKKEEEEETKEEEE